MDKRIPVGASKWVRGYTTPRTPESLARIATEKKQVALEGGLHQRTVAAYDARSVAALEAAAPLGHVLASVDQHGAPVYVDTAVQAARLDVMRRRARVVRGSWA